MERVKIVFDLLLSTSYGFASYGFAALKSGSISDSRSSCFSITGTYSQARFHYKTSTESTDVLKFYIDADNQTIMPASEEQYSDRSENIRIASHQISTFELWKKLEKYEVFISDIVIAEASKGNQKQAHLRLKAMTAFSVLEITDETENLTALLLSKKAVPSNSPEDALHIAVAAVNLIDFIVTWNFKHINNPFMRNTIRNVIEEAGYKSPVICSPDELLGAEDE